MSPEFVRRAVRMQAAPDPDEATAQTIAIMCEHIRAAANDPLIRAAAQTAIRQYAGGGPVWALRGIDPWRVDSLRSQASAEAIWWYVRHQIKFVHHQDQIVAWLGERHHLQLLIAPSVLLRFPFRMEGDCAIFSMLICAMLQSLGLRWELVTVAWDPNQPDIFLHVYPRAVLDDGSRLALDASHGKYPGWSIPLDRRLRTAVWNEDGQLVDDAGEQRFSGLHAYGFTGRMRGNGFGHYLRGRGFGQVDDTGGDITTTDGSSAPVDTSGGGPLVGPPLVNVTGYNAGSTDYAAGYANGLQAAGYQVGTDPSTGLATATTPASGGAAARTGYVAPSQSSAAWASFATAMGKAGMTLAEINSIQPGTVVAANGAIMRQATGYPVSGNPFGSIGTSLTAGGSSSIMWIGGGILALVVVASMMGGRR